jgi:DNA-binding transcriptional LysR family regulator
MDPNKTRRRLSANIKRILRKFLEDNIDIEFRQGRIYLSYPLSERVRGSETLNSDVPGALTLDEPTLMREAALAGAGLASLRKAWIAQDLAAGRLVSVLNEWMPSEPGLCLYYPGRRNVPASLRAFIDVIREIEPPANDETTGPARGDGVGPE